MAFRDLREFIDELDRRGQLRRIDAPVSSELEISEIADRVSKAHGPALLFNNVAGSKMPVLINAFGSLERVQLALGNLDDVAARVQEMIKPEVPVGFIDKLKKLPALAKMAGFMPSIVSKGVCQQVVKEGDALNLNEIPVLKCWPGDAGRFITLPLVFTKDPESGERNIGMYRMQVFDRNSTGMHWQSHHDGAANFEAHRRAGKRMPVAVAIGADPVLSYAATAPLPPGMDEAFFAGFIREKGVELVRCKTIDMEVPATAEIVLEGYVDPAEPPRIEGPFGDHTGFYSPAELYPVFHVTAITHRADAIYQTLIVGKPPQEDLYLGRATERLFAPLVRMMIPDMVDYYLPDFGVFHNCLFVSIRKRYPYMARKVMHAIWGLGQLTVTKMIVVVDEHVNVHDTDEVMFYVGANVDPRRDVEIVDGPVDELDHAAPFTGAGSKMGIDATAKVAGEGTVRPWPTEIRMDKAIRQRVAARWKELGLGDIA
ncbi:MAG: menaquinone biosynthesis decarboxylase [Phycisphaerae bacterium]|nr:menaquinone biosynthesis decarboxylase [Phycisphaerae bacterium]